MTPTNGPESAPSLVYTWNRYYVGDENIFYTNEISNRDEKHKELDKSYEDKYSDINSPYNMNNLIPTFDSDQLTGFKISDIESKKGYSTSIFTAPVPGYIESDDEVTLYSVTMNDDFYFDTIEYAVTKTVKINIDGQETDAIQTTTYEYKFLRYTRDVEIAFPSDLAGY